MIQKDKMYLNNQELEEKHQLNKSNNKNEIKVCFFLKIFETNYTVCQTTHSYQHQFNFIVL